MRPSGEGLPGAISGLPDDGSDLRGLMFSIAYRMTGSVTEAEDVVQEAFFRLERARRGGVVVDSPKSYVATATTRLAIDHLRSARARRESYLGTWLPEPIVADPNEGPEEMAELSDSLSMAFLVVLESLSPVERAVFLLREMFDYPYEEIAPIVDRSEGTADGSSHGLANGLMRTRSASPWRASTARPCFSRFLRLSARATSTSLSTCWQRTPSCTATGAARRSAAAGSSTGVTAWPPTSSVCSHRQRGS